MKFAGGLLSMAPRCRLRREEIDPIYDGGYSYPTYEPSPPPPPPPPPPPVDPWEQYQTPPYIPPLNTGLYLQPGQTYTPPIADEPLTLAEEVYFSLPYVDPDTGASVIPPHYNASTGEFFGPGATEVDTTNDSDSPTPITGPDSPFAIFADLVQGALGGGGGAVRQPQAPALVPVQTSGGGVNAGALLIVLALIGGAVWWFFFRKKKGASDGG